MSSKQNATKILDLLGISASTLCAIHCGLLPFIISVLPLIGLEFLSSSWFEWFMLASCGVLALTSFLVSYKKHHHSDEPISIMLIAFIFFVVAQTNGASDLVNQICMPIGGIIMAYAHYRNWKLCKEKNCKICK